MTISEILSDDDILLIFDNLPLEDIKSTASVNKRLAGISELYLLKGWKKTVQKHLKLTEKEVSNLTRNECLKKLQDYPSLLFKDYKDYIFRPEESSFDQLGAHLVRLVDENWIFLGAAVPGGLFFSVVAISGEANNHISEDVFTTGIASSFVGVAYVGSSLIFPNQTMNMQNFFCKTFRRLTLGTAKNFCQTICFITKLAKIKLFGSSPKSITS